GVCREVHGEVEIEAAQQREKGGPGKIELVPDVVGHADLMLHETAYQVFPEEDIGHHQSDGEQPVKHGGLDLDVALVMQEQGRAAENHDNDRAGDHGVVNLAMMEFGPGHLYKRCSNGHRRCHINVEQLVGNEKQDYREHVKKE